MTVPMHSMCVSVSRLVCADSSVVPWSHVSVSERSGERQSQREPVRQLICDVSCWHVAQNQVAENERDAHYFHFVKDRETKHISFFKEKYPFVMSLRNLIELVYFAT